MTGGRNLNTFGALMPYNCTPMKRIYGSHDSILIGQLKILLESNHIPCILRNDYLSGAAGELPPTECWPELWVVENDLAAPARKLIEAFLDSPSNAQQAWCCPGCNEHLEAQFSECWQCGRQRPPELA